MFELKEKNKHWENRRGRRRENGLGGTQWCCNGVTMVLQWCYNGVTMNGITKVSQ
jgi:hypothetical protein